MVEQIAASFLFFRFDVHDRVVLRIDGTFNQYSLETGAVCLAQLPKPVLCTAENGEDGSFISIETSPPMSEIERKKGELRLLMSQAGLLRELKKDHPVAQLKFVEDAREFVMNVDALEEFFRSFILMDAFSMTITEMPPPGAANITIVVSKPRRVSQSNRYSKSKDEK